MSDAASRARPAATKRHRLTRNTLKLAGLRGLSNPWATRRWLNHVCESFPVGLDVRPVLSVQFDLEQIREPPDRRVKEQEEVARIDLPKGQRILGRIGGGFEQRQRQAKGAVNSGPDEQLPPVALDERGSLGRRNDPHALDRSTEVEATTVRSPL